MGSSFIMPKQIISGEHALEDSKPFLAVLGKKALLVTDTVMVKLGNVALLTKALEEAGIDYVIYDGINGEPTDTMIDKGLQIYKENSCDFPTTAGTGSEATQFTIITDTKKDIKMLLKGAVLMPALAIIDPQFTMTAPPAITAATGLDALTHAIEAYTSRKSQPLTETFALSAVKRIFTYLPEAFHNGSNVTAREQMSIAALEAGIAFNNSSVTLVHGMSRPIGAMFHVPHGISNAMLLNVCFAFALDGAYGRFAALGREIGVSSEQESDADAANAFLSAVCGICKECEIPTLAGYGIDKEAFFAVIDKMAEDAIASGSPANTRKAVTKEDVVEMYKKLWE